MLTGYRLKAPMNGVTRKGSKVAGYHKIPLNVYTQGYAHDVQLAFASRDTCTELMHIIIETLYFIYTYIQSLLVVDSAVCNINNHPKKTLKSPPC